MFHCLIEIENKNAKEILKAIEIENENYVKARVEKNRLICEIESDNINSFIRTVDDLLQAISLSMRIIKE